MTINNAFPANRRRLLVYGLALLSSLVLLVSFVRDERQRLGPREYLAWMADPANGCVLTSYREGLAVSARYLTPEFRAWRDLGERYRDAALRDSLIDYYRQSVSFLLTIGPDERKEEGKDIMTGNVRSYGQFAQRVLKLNFGLEHAIRLNTNDREYAPVLSSLENVYGLAKNRKVFLVFADAENTRALTEAGHYELTWNDDVFSTGTHRFDFNNSDLESLPELVL